MCHFEIPLCSIQINYNLPVAGGFFGTAKVPLCCCCRCTAGTLDDRADLVELDDLA